MTVGVGAPANATFIPDQESETRFVTETLDRFRQIEQRAAATRGLERAAEAARHYRKYPWTNPALALAFADWKKRYGKPAARGLARAAQRALEAGEKPKEALEAYAMTKEFQRRVELERHRRKFPEPTVELAKWKRKYGTQQAREMALNAYQMHAVRMAGPPTPGPIDVAFAALAAPFEELQGQFMSALTGLIGPIGDQAEPVEPGSVEDRMGVVRGSPDVKPLSTAGIALERLAAGEPVDLAAAREERDRRLREIASITYDGEQHFLTPGRAFAYAFDNAFDVVEPGTVPFDIISGAVDAAAIIFLDPVNIPLYKLGDIVKARKVFSAADYAEAGAISSWRKFTHGPTAQQFWSSERGQRILHGIAQSDPQRDFLWWMQATNWKWPSRLLADALDQTTPEGVRAILEPASGATNVISRVPSPWSLGTTIRRVTGRHRFGNMRPWRAIDLDLMDGPSGALRDIFLYLKHGGVDDATVSPLLHEIATSRSRFGIQRGIAAAFDTFRAEMIARGVPRDLAHQATRVWHNDLAEGALYHIDLISKDMAVEGIVIDGQLLRFDRPHQWVQMLDNNVWLPDPREVDKLYARWGRLLGIPGTGRLEARGVARLAPKAKYAAWATKTAATHLQSKLWVPVQLIRGAWTVRVIGDEQARMTTAGYDAIPNHPLRQIAWVLSRKNPDEAALLASPQGQRSLTRGARMFLGDPNASVMDVIRGDQHRRVVASGRDVFHPGDARYTQSWADQLLMFHADPPTREVATVIATGGDLAAVKQNFWDGALSKFRNDMAEAPDLTPILGTRTGADAYIDHLAKQVLDLTGGHGDLVAFVASGKYGDEAARAAGQVSLGGRHARYAGGEVLIVEHEPGAVSARIYKSGADEPLTVPVADLEVTDTAPIRAQTMAHDGVRTDRKFVAYLEKLPDEIKPANVIGQRVVTGDELSLYDRTVRHAMAALMDVPTNILNRQSVFRQAYWRRITEMAADLDPAAQHRLLAQVDAAKGLRRIPRAVRDALHKAVARGSGELTYREADLLAKGHALDEVLDLLYDLNKRSQFFDATRLLFPFGEAWKEIITTWARLVAENPQVIRRVQVGIEALHDVNPFEYIPGAVPDPFRDQGFFFNDPNTGQDSFFYPFSHKITGNLMELISGDYIPVPHVGTLRGLSLGFSIMPGLGPGITFLANEVMDRFLSDPKYDPIREFLFPYGEPDIGRGLLESFAPPWLQKFITSWSEHPEDVRMLNNVAAQIYAYGVSVGRYDPNDPSRIETDWDDAIRKAGWVYRIRGTFQWGAPSPPSPRFVVESKKGLVLFTMLRDEWYRLYQDDPDTAIAKFFDRFGEDAFYATQSFTLSGAYALPFTNEQVKWARKNPQIVAALPTVYGFFAPPGDPEDFDFDAYARSIERGERTSLTALPNADWVRHVNNTLGWWQYDQLRRKLGLGPGDVPNARQRQFLAAAADAIHRDYPGWQQVTVQPNRLTRAVEELEAATKRADLRRQHPELIEALETFFRARDRALAAVVDAGGTNRWNRPGYRTADKYAPIRRHLTEIGEGLAELVPAFRNVWETVLVHDVGEVD